MSSTKLDSSYPSATKKPKTFTLHGHKRLDNYAWLKDPNWQQVILEPDQLSSEIRKYLKAENSYVKKILGDTEEIQNTLFSEMRARIKEDDNSVPEKDGKYFYYIRYEENQQYPIYCRYHIDTPERTQYTTAIGT